MLPLLAPPPPYMGQILASLIPGLTDGQAAVPP